MDSGGRPHAITDASLQRLHGDPIDDPSKIRAILVRLHEERLPLRSGFTSRGESELGYVELVGDDRISLNFSHFEVRSRTQIFLRFELDGATWFFAASLKGSARGRVNVAFPASIYSVERRDLSRSGGDRTRVELTTDGSESLPGTIADWSYHGLGIDLREDRSPVLSRNLKVRFLDGERAGQESYAILRHKTPAAGRPGWIRIGLQVTDVDRRRGIQFERRDTLLDQTASQRLLRRLTVARAAVQLASNKAARSLGLVRQRAIDIPIVDYENSEGEPMRAIIDSWGNPHRAPAIVIPPAWGKTKETLLPLAAVIVETFKRAGQPIVVIRFDGIRRRGESYIDPDCRFPGRESLRCTYSQLVRDIDATVDFLEHAPQFEPAKIILVTFSAASVSGRRAVVADKKGRITGWVSVVGMPDLQYSMRITSGGIDYAYGALQGIRFGTQEVLGVLVDMDFVARDAIDHRLVFLEDARRDMSEIKVPVTWIHGQHDAWMDTNRVQELLSCGDTDNRYLLEVPTGHQLRNSKQALDTFQLIASEVGAMVLGRRLDPSLPDLATLDARREAERRRVPPPAIDLRRFWRDYLIGRDRRVGMELLTATSAYRELMATQVRLLEPRHRDRIADLGSGTGSFPQFLAGNDAIPGRLEIYEIDVVSEAHHRARHRLRQRNRAPGLSVHYALADLDVSSGVLAVPLRSSSCDGVLASLLISYVPGQEALLREIFRVLVPGGTVVLSTLRRDADISKIYVEGVAELPVEKIRETFGDEAARDYPQLTRDFLNDAARILEFEERDLFRFWEPAELAAMVRRAGFADVATEVALGTPPQALVVRARRP